MTFPKISLTNIGNLLFSSLLGLVFLYYAHDGLEAEAARPNRSLIVMGGWAALGLLGLLVFPSVRDRVVPAFLSGVRLAREGRRVTDKVVAVVDETPKEPPT